MRYYILHNKKKVYFEFSLFGLREAMAYCENQGWKKRTIHVENNK